MSDSARHLRASEVFKRAIELTDPERERYLLSTCQDDADLLQEVRSLLSHDAPELDSPSTSPDPLDMDSSAPKMFGRYELRGKIGRGGMGLLWKAWDPHLDRDVALKFLPRELDGRDGARRRFLREGRAASKLKHDGIATVYEAGEIDGRAYIAFEFVDGVTLTQQLEKGPLPAAEAFRVAIDAARALAHAHERSVFHRDITCNNIMITRDGRVVIVDFGLAVAAGAERLTRTGTAVGTMPYMSPEALRGIDPDDNASFRGTDIYGLGVTLYEMLTGSVPFHAVAVPQLIYAIQHEEAPPPSTLVSTLPATLDVVVLKALAKEPGKRYTSALEFADAMEGMLRSGTLPAVPPDQAIVRRPRESTGPPPSTAKAVRRKRWLLGVPVAIALLALAVWKFMPPASHSPLSSVAVLPFTVSGPDTDVPHWLTSGLGQQLVTKLSKLEGVRVMTWASSQHFAPGPDRSVRDIARQLNVDGIVMVTLQREDTRLHGSVEIVDGRTEFVRWSGEFEGLQGDLVTMERNLAHAVAEGIFGQLPASVAGTISTPAAQSAQAYELYLRGAEELQTQTPEANASALAFFGRAVELDPQLADAHVGIGAVHLDRVFFGWSGTKSVDVAEHSLRAALSIDPENRFALRGLMQVEGERGRLEEALKLGVRVPVGPDARVDDLMARAQSYAAGGLIPQSLPLFGRVIEIEPTNQGAHWWRVVMDAWAFQPDSCIAHAEEYFAHFGDEPEMHLWVGFAHEQLGNIDEARVHYLRCLDLFGENSNGYADSYVANFLLSHGMESDARVVVDRAVLRAERKLAIAPDNERWVSVLLSCYSLGGRRSDFLRLAPHAESIVRNAYLSSLVSDYARLGLEDDATRVLCRVIREQTFFNDSTAFFLLWGKGAHWSFPLPHTPEAEGCIAEAIAHYDELSRKY